MTGTSAWIAADGDFRPSRPWSAMNGSTVPSRQPRISPSRMPSQASAVGRLDDLRKARADVVQVARVETDVRAALVELGADAVVLVLDPDLRPEPGDDLGGVLGRGGEHELERVEQGQRAVAERVVTGQAGQSADIADQHARPLDVVEGPVEGRARWPASTRPSRRPMRRSPPSTLTMYFAVIGSERSSRLRRIADLLGRAGSRLDLGECGGHLGECRARLRRRGVAGRVSAPPRRRCQGPTSGRMPRPARRAGRCRSP